ncbi:MAG: hypothetical protein ACFFER_11050 [Candidatus Thorarchaeota archaeon]
MVARSYGIQALQNGAMDALVFGLVYIAITVLLTFLISRAWYNREGSITGGGIACIGLMLQLPLLILFMVILANMGLSDVYEPVLLQNMGIVIVVFFALWCCLGAKQGRFGSSPDLITFRKQP